VNVIESLFLSSSEFCYLIILFSCYLILVYLSEWGSCSAAVVLSSSSSELDLLSAHD
jgi:hypothetical protein